MTCLINFWLVSRNLEYVLELSIAKFLKNVINLNRFEVSKKRFTIKLLEINT